MPLTSHGNRTTAKFGNSAQVIPSSTPNTIDLSVGKSVDFKLRGVQNLLGANDGPNSHRR